ncbi:LBF_2804 family protein [Ferruginibacter sp.]
MRPIYHLFYRLLPIKKVNTDNQLFLLTEEEIKIIRNKERIAIWLAAFFGAMGVVLLYVPQYAFPHLFPDTAISLFGKTFKVPIIMLVYSVVLVIIEIMLLTFLNIWCTHEIAVATGFLNYQSKKEKEKRNLLINIGLEKKNKAVLKYGIDPLQGINKKALMAWNFFFILKATLSNMLFKILIQRLLGRYAVKALQDFAGIPIFAAWNAYGTKVILKEARVIIMGQNLIEVVCQRIRKDQEPTEAFKQLLYDTLQYIAISKRDFHQNHFILTKNLFEIYNVQPKDNHWLEEGYYEKLRAAGKEEKEVCQLLIVIGFLLDGRLSVRERLQVHELRKEGLLDISTDEITAYQRDFLNGRGIEGLIAKYI